MSSLSLIVFGMAAFASANPVSIPTVPDFDEVPFPFLGLNLTVPSYNSTPFVAGTTLHPYEVVLYGENRMEVVHQDTWEQVIAPHLESVKNYTEPMIIHSRSEGLDKRAGCLKVTNHVVDRTQNFVDWDAQMSPIVHASSKIATTVAVMSGYSITNTLGVSAGLDWKAIKDVLSASIGINYSRAWQTTNAVTVTFTIDPQFSGAIITKPASTRKWGRVMSGCVGAMRQVGTFEGTSRTDGINKGLQWVQGQITLCQKKITANQQLSRCNGGGFFV